jgi:hypothetical protein
MLKFIVFKEQKLYHERKLDLKWSELESFFKIKKNIYLNVSGSDFHHDDLSFFIHLGKILYMFFLCVFYRRKINLIISMEFSNLSFICYVIQHHYILL